MTNNLAVNKTLSYTKIIYLISFLLLYSYAPLVAQVTVGMPANPTQGAILDIKNDANNSQKGGLLISRVLLNNLEEIHFISEGKSTTELQELHAQHIGHIVYNIGSQVNDIEKGLYYWDGKKWQLLLTGDISTAGPWYKIQKANEVALNNTEDAYINAKVVVGGNTTTAFNTVETASLSVIGGDASFNNVSFGSGKNNTAGSQNIAAGKYALESNISGVNNSALGYAALKNNTEGNNNIALGANALSSLTTGSQNVAIGYKAGSNLTSGSNNLSIGANTQLPSATANSQINIGNAMLGKVGSIAIGKTTPATSVALDVSKSWIVENVEKSDDGYVLVVDKNGYIGKSEVAPLMYAYINSKTSQTISDDSKFTENSLDNFVPLIWSNDDVPDNNGIISLNPDRTTFSVTSEFVAQISGFINYIPYASYNTTYNTTRDGASALLNIAIQVKTSTTSWETIATSRGVWTQGERYGALQSVTIPQVIHTLNVGDQIRLVVNWPNSTVTPSIHYGLPHNTNGMHSKVTMQDGVMYSKGLRIISL